MKTKMKMKFNPNLDYQNEAIQSVVDIFKGQGSMQSNFTIYEPRVYEIQTAIKEGIEETEIGVANKLELDNEDIEKNLKDVQLKNRLKPYKGVLSLSNLNFSIEMETGTGKTYVYIKSIMELYKNYGFKKYIILVPSVAIKEGVLASLKILKDHFKLHYAGDTYHYFQYSSDRLNELMAFARSDKIEIMVMTIQSFDSDNKVLNSSSQKHLEKTNGVKPIDVINRTSPIVIIDEPQTTSSSQQRKAYIKDLNPLCTLQYSATHRENKDVHKVYRLTAIDAYIKKLVKEIEVASVIPRNDNNYAYVKLLDVKSTRNKIKAELVIDRRDKKTYVIERKKITVEASNDLYDHANEREMYRNMRIEKITSDPEKSIVINGTKIQVGQEINSFDPDILKRIQIRKTIEEHFAKEKRLNPKGIKVLSLFFIDKVANYRSWEDNMSVDGKFLTWFEEEYIEVAKEYSENKEINSIKTPVQKVHQGYFAEDSKRHFKNTQGYSVDDIKAYESIMSDKESLLSFNNNIRFIFSHSALREGWDNPNVFQICTLNENSKNGERKRQEIGRGLRICVNQDGERVFGFETNTLTVMANQTYEDFARQLQGEIEEDDGFVFGHIAHNSFAAIPLIGNEIENMTENESEKLFEHFILKGYIDHEGKVTDTLKLDLNNNSTEIPTDFKEYQSEILDYLKQVCGSLKIKNKDTAIVYRRNKQITENNPYFKELWNRIKNKTTYTLNFDTPVLIKKCSDALKIIEIGGVEVEYTRSRIQENTTGIEAHLNHQEFENYDLKVQYLPDIITFLQNSTYLTRQTIVKILRLSKTLHYFYTNPQLYMTKVSEIINDVLVGIMIANITYIAKNGQEYKLEDVFPDEEIQGYLEDLVKSDKSVYEYNKNDSKTELNFAKALQDSKDVLVYTKLPTQRYIIPTPLGNYTPDWAIVYDNNGTKELYFVVETKGTVLKQGLRGVEIDKIEMGEKRFSDVGGASFLLANKFEDFSNEAIKYKDENGKTQKK